MTRSLDSSMQVLRASSMERVSWLRHGFSTRSGGVSECYGGATLNLGWTKEDEPGRVRTNRQRFLETVSGASAVQPFRLVGLRQTHSTLIHEIREPNAAAGELETSEGKPVLEGDGLITGVPGVLLAVGTADCVPVLLVDTSRRVVAAFHAGWRGTVARIVESGVARLRQSYGSRPEDLLAAIGPSIGPCCYEVGDEVLTAFSAAFPYADQLFHQVESPEPQRTPAASTAPVASRKVHLDLWEANRRQLLQAGLADSQITVMRACTACARDPQGHRLYFSHRGEEGVTGRMLSGIGVTRQSL